MAKLDKQLELRKPGFRVSQLWSIVFCPLSKSGLADTIPICPVIFSDLILIDNWSIHYLDRSMEQSLLTDYQLLGV